MSAEVVRDEAAEADRDRAVRRVLVVEGCVNVLVLAAKTAAGLATGSLALLSDALHSLTDAGNNVIAFLVMRHAEKPPDHNHPYGHRKFETLAVFGLAMLLVVIAFELITRALFGERGPVTNEPWALAVMLAALGVNLALSLWEAHQARRLTSGILHADASHTFADVLTTATVIAGWQFAARGHAWVETLATLLVAGFVLYLSFQLFKRAIPVLVDEGAVEPKELARAVRGIDGVREVRQARSRWLGDHAYVDVVVAVDADLTTESAHDIADRIEAVLEERFAVRETSVHVEPL